MSKKIVYLLGAGASAYALPVVGALKERFNIFCEHFLFYLKNKHVISTVLAKAHEDINSLTQNLDSHYTIDTYAKKLYLQEMAEGGDKGYRRLKKYLSAFFLYEQIIKNKIEECCKYFDNSYPPYATNIGEKINPKLNGVNDILKDFDYRYDSFFASILEVTESEIIIPDNVTLISWNYDYQVEKAFINFTNKSLQAVQKRFQIFGSFQDSLLQDDESYSLIKLNGTAGFKNGDGNKDVVNFKDDVLNDKIFDTLTEILLTDSPKYFDGVRFAWEDSKLSMAAVKIANKKMKEADIIVIIGYSFPYFNRQVDRQIFSGLENIGPNKKIYLQAPANSIDSIENRFKAIFSKYGIEKHTETDQFLIPNEF